MANLLEYNLKDKKAAKKLLKRAKEHPEWYTPHDIYFAKQAKRRIKLEEKLEKDAKRQSKDTSE